MASEKELTTVGPTLGELRRGSSVEGPLDEETGTTSAFIYNLHPAIPRNLADHIISSSKHGLYEYPVSGDVVKNFSSSENS